MDDNIRFTEEEMELLMLGLPSRNTEEYRAMQDLLDDYDLLGIALRMEEIKLKKQKIAKLQKEVDKLIEELPCVLKDKV